MARPLATGMLHWAFPAMLLVGAVDVATSGRDLTQSFSDLQALAEPVRLPAVVWLQRAVSVLLLVAALEQIVNHIALTRRTPSWPLLAAFLVFWAGTSGSPAVFGAHPSISHELLYALAMGTACCLAWPDERDRILRAARDTLMVLMLAGLAAMAWRPTLVMDPSYREGLLQGLPRFAGLTSHPVTQGALAQIAPLLLWACPYTRRWMNRAAWVLALGVLLIAQSKAAWIACVVCLGAMAAVRHGGGFWRRMGDPRHGAFGLLALGTLALSVLALAAALVMGDAGGRIADFLESPQGARLATMTGRDRIWAIAEEEWQAHPAFGYGLPLWDAWYRAQINMPNATHAHNQFMDNAARAGSVGAAALVLYVGVLLAMSLRHARATAGLSLGLFLSLALRAISEVPLSLQGYGTELFIHLLLLVTLAAAAASQPVRARPAGALRHGVVP